jgi:uncharacterized membrane protein YfhO
LSAILQQKQQVMQQNAAQAAEIRAYFDGILYNLKTARTSLLKADAFRSFAFVLIASGSIWLYSTKKLSGKYLLWGLGVLVLIDLWTIDKRYLGNDDFQSKRKAKQTFALTPADKAINKVKNEGERVFTIYRDPFTEVNTSYHHQSIGGYHGAKLRRYQDVIEWYLQNNWQTLIRAIQQQGNINVVQNELAEMPVLNMLNGKYIVFNPNAQPIINNYAFGDAWFVKETYPVESPDGSIEALRYVPLTKSAIVNISEFNELENYKVDSIDGTIKLTDYKPNHLEYSYSSKQEQLAVFSQIYYPKGWKAYVDGEQVKIYRTNYILRALMLPPGQHKVEFRFEPTSFKAGQMVSLIGSLLMSSVLGSFYLN